jgi:DNA-binding response OmpR family regulator
LATPSIDAFVAAFRLFQPDEIFALDALVWSGGFFHCFMSFAGVTIKGAPAADGNASEVLVFEGWRLDLLRRELRRQTGDLVPLTAGEFELLCVFARHPNRVLNRDQLIDFVKGREWAAYDQGIDTQVMRLRKKIEADLSSPSLIKTVRGAGYVFAAAVTVD